MKMNTPREFSINYLVPNQWSNKFSGLIQYAIFYFRDYLEEDIFGENAENDWAANDDDISDGKYEIKIWSIGGLFLFEVDPI